MSWLAHHPYSLIESIADTAASSAGKVSVAASAMPHTKGSWIELIASTARDTYAIHLILTGSSISGTDTAILLDL